MECGKLTAKLRDAVPVCFIVDGKEVKRFKNIEIPDEIKQLPFIDFKFDVPTTGAITFKIVFEAGVLPEVWPEARQRKQRGSKELPEVQAAEAAVEAAIMAGLEQADAEGQPVREVAEMIERGAEVTAEIEGNELMQHEKVQCRSDRTSRLVRRERRVKRCGGLPGLGYQGCVSVNLVG